MTMVSGFPWMWVDTRRTPDVSRDGKDEPRNQSGDGKVGQQSAKGGHQKAWPQARGMDVDRREGYQSALKRKAR